MSLKTIIINILALLFLVALGFLFDANYELKQVEEYSGFQGEARTNDLYAARLFLKRMGIPAQSLDYTGPPADTKTVIFLDTQRYNISSEKIEALLDWVQQGGHLIARTRSTHSDFSILADTPFENDRKPDVLQNALKISSGESVYLEEEQLPLEINLPNTEETLSVGVDFFYSIIAPQASFSASHENNNWLVQQKYGEGLVSFLADSSIFSNRHLEDEDHAKLLWYLVHSHAKEISKVWLIDKDDYPSLMKLLQEYAWTVLLSLALLILLTLWAWIPRLGPLIDVAPPFRRQLLEHIRASGFWLWNNPEQRQEKLIQATRQQIQQLAQKRVNGGQLLDDKKITQQLALYLNWPDDKYSTLEHLLKSPQLSEAEFLNLVKIANTLRNST
ncbi:DUF4350 domain-containing protein [Thiolinea disciformis]|uniref:DUF4350 domain-containing protein n=1 Tax=Thiolinea disciformis TaxID=125614 RepID=UPI0003815B8D|nr:DUF4350 domain-containing protein [Thiolinea disciformis]